MKTEIREYTQADQNSCVDALKSNVPKYFTHEEIADFENFLTRIENNKNTKYYVVIVDGQIIGCGGFGDKDHTGVISLAWGLIDNSFHQKGFGEQLLLYRLEQIKQLYPGSPLVIDTTQYSYGFFEKYGFYTTKITNDFYAPGMHRYDMMLKN